jgi:hypothetical protein
MFFCQKVLPSTNFAPFLVHRDTKTADFELILTKKVLPSTNFAPFLVLP